MKSAILAQAILAQVAFRDSFRSFASPGSRPSRFLMVRRRWRPADVPEGWVQVDRGPRPRSVQWPRASQQPSQPAERGQSRQQPFSEGHGSPGTGNQVGVRSGSSARCGGSRSQQSPDRIEAGQGGEVVAVGRAGERVRGFLVESPGLFDRVGCEAGHGECEHPGRRTEVGCNENPTSAVCPHTTSARRRFRIAAVARDCCAIEGSVASDQAGSNIGMPLFQASMQEGRFHSELRGGVTGVDRRTTSQSPRRNGGGEARRGREHQRHQGQGSSAVATRSCSWSDVVHGDKRCELRPTFGLCGVRVGEASHPGPVQTQNARRLQSTQVDSEGFVPRTVGRRSTQIDPEDDPPVRSGRFAPQIE